MTGLRCEGFLSKDSEELGPRNDETRSPKASLTSFSGCAIATLVAAVAVVRWTTALAINSGRGLDPSDESFYLLNAQHPDATVARQSDFGYYTHLLLRLSGDSLSWFRLAGLASLLLSCVAAAHGVIQWLPHETPSRWRRTALVLASTCVAAVALTHYGIWLVTPGYNLLTLDASLLVFAGMLIALSPTQDKHEPRPWWRPRFGFVLVGAAGIVLTDVKITAGIAVGLVCLVTIVTVVGPRDALKTAWSLGTGVTTGAILNLLVVGSPVATVRETIRYARMTEIARDHPSSALWQATFLWANVVPWLLMMAVAGLCIAALWRVIHSDQSRIAFMTIATGVVTMTLWGDRPHGGLSLLSSGAGWWWLQMTGWTLLFITALAPTWNRTLSIGPFIALGAVAAGFGSSNGLIRQTVLTSGLYGLAVTTQATIVAFTVIGYGRRMVPAAVFIVAAGLSSITQVQQALNAPYRVDAPIETNNVSVHVGAFGTVDVTPVMANYITALQALSPHIPATARDCLVDLSGGTPVSAIALNARSATTDWVYGGGPGASASLEYLLQFAPCIKGPVLLIDSPDGGLRMKMPAVLRGRASRVLGEVYYRGYLNELHVVSILEPKSAG